MSNRILGRLREAMGEPPCKEHKETCPIPKKGRLLPCQWGHTAAEFMEHCDPCAVLFLKAMGKLSYAQRRHHHKERS